MAGLRRALSCLAIVAAAAAAVGLTYNSKINADAIQPYINDEMIGVK